MSISSTARARLLCLFITVFALGSPSAFAALGGQPLANSPSAAGVLKTIGSPIAGSAAVYTSQRLELTSGTTIQEFVSSNGKVFAVKWSGPVLPDFGMLLGTSVAVFNSEVRLARNAGKRGGALGIQSQGLVVFSAGHMRSFHGYAYLESLVPAGVDIVSLIQTSHE